MSRYVARKRARFKSNGKYVNLPWGTVLEADKDFIYYKGVRLCAVTSQNAYDYFSIDDDGQGVRRGQLVTAIEAGLNPREAEYQVRWDKVWGAPACWRYRHPEHEDRWIWNWAFYNAPIADLESIARLIGVARK